VLRLKDYKSKNIARYLEGGFKTQANHSRIKEVVRILVSELNNENEGTRNLALAQLVTLGKRVTPHICVYLGIEAEFQRDLKKLYDDSHCEYSKYPDFVDPVGQANWQSRVLLPFESKWGEVGRIHYYDPFFINYLLEALGIISDKKSIPFLRQLPVIDFAGESSIFARAQEIASKIERNNRVVG
jgi:hypothetical protein